MIKHKTFLKIFVLALPLVLFSGITKANCGYTGTGGYYYNFGDGGSNRHLAGHVTSRLRSDQSICAEPIAVAAYGHKVVLTGSVSNRYQKQRAIDITRYTPGARVVDEDIYVRNE